MRADTETGLPGRASCGAPAGGLRKRPVRPALLAAASLLVVALAAPAPLSAAEPARSFTITAGGDILIHRSIAQVADEHAPGRGAFDFYPLLEPIEPWVSSADLAICHLEGTLTYADSGFAFYPRFKAPNEVADALKAAGYDACSVAGNHTLDFGISGIRETLKILDAAGIRHTGSAGSAWGREPNLYQVNGVTVGHLSYTSISNSGRPSSKPWTLNMDSKGDAILADARWLREQGAEFVILSMHWGSEYQVRPSPSQIALAERLLASPDIDLILGTHVHVIQPIGRVGDKVVVYGMGNQLSNIRGSTDGRVGAEDGIMVHLQVTEVDGAFRVTQVQYTPTWVHPTTKQVLPVEHTLAYGPASLWPVLRASLQRTVNRVTLLNTPDISLSSTPWPSLIGGRWTGPQ
jgi:poly-gamma-glutamate capsule biosynthesis protein CapA/YwtB (metallophosphatase superfamily)